MSKRRLLTGLLWLLTLLWTALLFGFSGQDGQESADLSTKVTLWIMNLLPGLPGTFDQLHYIVRKIAHFTIFGAEGVLLSCALMRSLNKTGTAACIALPACLVIAALNEYHQSFMEGRVASILDVGIDFAGAVCGVIFVWIMAQLLRRRNAKVS